MATELKEINVEMKECQFVKNPYAEGTEADTDEQDDDDDFDDDGDDETSDSTPSKKLKISSAAKLGCSMRSVVNTKIKEMNEKIIETAIMKIKDYTSPATRNVWYMFLELEYSF